LVSVILQVDLKSLSPQVSDSSFYEWWERASNDISGLSLQGFNSLTILGAWTIWNQRNRCVFDGAALNMAHALTLASEERKAVDGWGSRNFILKSPYLCRLERKIVWSFFTLQLQARLSLWNLLGVCVCVLG
jgi:hypothetical protein